MTTSQIVCSNLNQHMTYADVVVSAAEYNLEGDGPIDSYEMLFNAVRDVNDNKIPGMICEIGVRMGYGIFTMMCAGGLLRYYLGIDPYGNLLYDAGNRGIVRYDYTNTMKNTFLKNIYKWCYDANIDFNLLSLEDTEFFNRFNDGVPLYNKEKQIERQYAVVHIDGPHSLEAEKQTTEWLESRVPVGGYIIYDDINFYDHSIIHKLLVMYGFNTIYEVINTTNHVRRAYKRYSIGKLNEK